MKVLKVIFKLFTILLFTASLILNVFTFRSSYGTLLFKYDESKFSAMVGSKHLEFSPIYFLDKKDAGIQINSESNKDGKIATSLYEFHFDSEGKMVAKASDTDSANKTTYSYYKDGYVYKEVGSLKTKLPTNETLFVSNLLLELTSYQQVLMTDIEDSDTKTTMDFSFSSGYILGIKYKMNEDTSFHYDLEGRLRKIETVLTDGTSKSFTITYKNQKITLPDLNQY